MGDGWRYEHKTTGETFTQPNRANMDPRYWKETPPREGALDDVAHLLREIARYADEHDDEFVPELTQRALALLSTIPPSPAPREGALDEKAIDNAVTAFEAEFYRNDDFRPHDWLRVAIRAYLSALPTSPAPPSTPQFYDNLDGTKQCKVCGEMWPAPPSPAPDPVEMAVEKGTLSWVGSDGSSSLEPPKDGWFPSEEDYGEPLLDTITVEACAKVADRVVADWTEDGPICVDAVDAAKSIASAIRALVKDQAH